MYSRGKGIVPRILDTTWKIIGLSFRKLVCDAG